MKLAIDRLHIEADAKVDAYIDEKIGKLDHLVPRHARQSARCEIKLKKGPGRGKKQFICEVVIHLPNEIITTHQTADSLNAAIDMAEARLKNQLKKYKGKRLSHRQRLVRRLRRR